MGNFRNEKNGPYTVDSAEKGDVEPSSMPKVSIITPVYNRPEYLEEAVISMQNQTYTDWEHIIIDDGSTNPKTKEILLKIAAYPKVKIFHTSNNGLGAARNFGIKQSTGRYILTLDDDDKFKDNFLNLAVDVLNEQQNVGIVGAWVQEFGFSKRKKKLSGSDVKSFLVSSNTPACSLFRKQCWIETGGYDETKYFMGYADWDFWLKITSLKWTCHIIPNYLFKYRVHKTGAMHDEDDKNKHQLLAKLVQNNMDVYKAHLEYYMLKKSEQTDAIIHSMKSTVDYKIGNFLITPFRKIVHFFIS